MASAQGTTERAPRSVPRRDFLRTSLIGATGAGLASFAVASLGFLWPNLRGSFGAEIVLPTEAEELFSTIREERAPMAYPAGRLYVVTWDPTVAGAEEAYGDDHVVLSSGQGLMALYHKCPHLGCRVPWCQSSQWFECPCHGSKYNRWGEWTDGPAPRGMDRFPTRLDDADRLVVDTSVILTGPSRTARVLEQEPEGPHCVDL